MDGATRAELHDLRGLPAGFKYDFNPTDQEILKHLEDKVTGKLHPLIDKFIPTLEKENDICYTHPERLPGASKDGQIRYFFHRPGTRKRRRIQTGDDGRETRWRITGNILPVSIEGTLKGFRKIFVSDGYRCHQYHLGHNEEEEGVLVVSKMFYLTQQQQYGFSIKGSTGRKTDFPKRGTLSLSKSDDGEDSLRSTIITPHHSPTPNQTETGGTEEQRMEAQITINPGAPDMKNKVSRLDKVPLSSLPPAGVQAWGSAPGSCNQAWSLHQMGLPASASCRPNVGQSWPWGSDFTGNQNADPTPAAHNQNPYQGQVQVNPEIGGAQPGNLYATPRPVGQNQEPVYPGVGIGSVSMSPRFTIRSAGSSTINFNNANTNNVSAPHWAPHWAK